MKRERYNLSIAVFVVLRKGDDICMIRRAHTGWMDGFYSLPAGGLEYGETLAQAAAREVKEETGITLTEDNLALAHTIHVWTEDRSWIGHFFICDQWEGTPYVAEPDKHSALGWQPISALPEHTIPYVKQALRYLEQGQAYSEYGWPAQHPSET